MKKIVILTILFTLDILLLIYLKQINENKIPFNYKDESKQILLNKKDLELNNINDFNFDEYFQVLTINKPKYSLNINDNISITLNNKEYKFDFKIIEPEIIEKIIYENVPTSYENEDMKNKIDEYFYVENYYFEYVINTDIDKIAYDLSENVYSTNDIRIDYSRLNTSQIGQYSIFYLSNNEKIEIFVNII